MSSFSKEPLFHNHLWFLLMIECFFFHLPWLLKSLNFRLSAPNPGSLQTKPLYTYLYMWCPPMTSALSFLNQILICLQLVSIANFFYYPIFLRFIKLPRTTWWQWSTNNSSNWILKRKKILWIHSSIGELSCTMYHFLPSTRMHTPHLFSSVLDLRFDWPWPLPALFSFTPLVSPSSVVSSAKLSSMLFSPLNVRDRRRFRRLIIVLRFHGYQSTGKHGTSGSTN